MDAVENSGSIGFRWIDGGHTAKPPPGFENYFGPAPHYRFVDYDGVNALDDMSNRIREFPQGLSAEDTMRKLVGEEEVYSLSAVETALNRIFETLDKNPDIDVCFF